MVMRSFSRACVLPELIWPDLGQEKVFPLAQRAWHVTYECEHFAGDISMLPSHEGTSRQQKKPYSLGSTIHIFISAILFQRGLRCWAYFWPLATAGAFTALLDLLSTAELHVMLLAGFHHSGGFFCFCTFMFLNGVGISKDQNYC